MKKILWDLDGTLIDPNQRLYSLFCELTGNRSISYAAYWGLKAKGFNQQRMLQEINYGGDEKVFRDRWLKNIERKELLEKDVLQDGAEDVLKKLNNQGYHMYIVTNRQKYENLVEQLQFLGIDNYFRGVIATMQKRPKAEAVLKELEIGEHDLFIGDSMEDIHAAKDLGIQSIQLVKGTSLNICIGERPCYTVNTISEIPLLLERIS